MKTVVITGASTGIGLASVKACLQKGYKVIATARKQDDLKMLQALGALAVELELSDKPSVEAAAEQILQLSSNRIDCLFNNAGYGLQVAMEDATWESLQDQHTTNVVGPIHLPNQLLPALPKNSQIIFNSSVLGLITIAFRGPYCMSKYALEAAADTYRLELEALGINVHLIEPGPIEADFRPNALKVFKDVLGDKTPRLDYANHLARLTQKENTAGTLPASRCAEIVVGIIEGTHRKPRYLVTKVAKQAAFMKRLLGSGFHKLAKSAEPVRDNPKA